MPQTDGNAEQPEMSVRMNRAFGRARVLAGTAIVGAIAFGAVSLGTGVIAANTVRIAVTETAAPITVEVERVALQTSYRVPQEFIGQVEPRQDSQLGFENGGTIAAILVDEGDSVRKGQLLARLDTRITEARLAQARAVGDALVAQVELAQLTFERQQTLADRSFASQQRADEARLNVAELKARLAAQNATITEIDVALDKAEIRAPFDGRISARAVDEGTRISPSTPVLDLQETAAPQLRVGLSPAAAAQLTAEDIFDVTIEGAPYVARFSRRQNEINPVTRSVPVLFDLEATADNPTPPYGAVVRLSMARDIVETGAWLPISALAEGPRGLWTVLTIDQSGDTDTVALEAVELIYTNEDRAFVRGALVDGVQVIATGTHRIAPGQTVRPVEG